ncbi:hypothetical protein HMPREF9413_4822 [Paenibacillus sp. HGF7]|nr:hypothetical protein HMPREF9413_4822 [Paenibacillus sp. HGF7]
MAGDNPSINKERDRIFYEVIENLSENKEGTWGIVIVGSNHAADTPGSMRNLLDQRGHQCIVNLIDSI